MQKPTNLSFFIDSVIHYSEEMVKCKECFVFLATELHSNEREISPAESGALAFYNLRDPKKLVASRFTVSPLQGTYFSF